MFKNVGFGDPAQHGNNGARVSAMKRSERTEKLAHVATSEREYSRDEMDFLGAIEVYKNRTGKKYPTWTEVLGVVRELGYVKPM